MPRVLAATVLATMVMALSSNNSSSARVAEKVDLMALTCKDLISQPDGDREVTIAFIHGFLLGRKQATVADIEVLAGATDKIVDECLDNPRDKAMDVFIRND